MRCSHVAVTALCGGLMCSQAVAITRSWDGGAGTSNWQDALNWNPDGLPQPADDVVIDIPGQTITVSLASGSATINSVSCAEHFQNSSGTTLSIAAPSTMHSIQLGGILTGTGDLTITGPVQWVGNGMMLGTGRTTFAAGGFVEILTSPNVNRSMDFHCDATWTGGVMSLGGATIRNYATFTITSQAEMRGSGAPGAMCAFENYGVLRKTGFGTAEFIPSVNPMPVFNHGEIHAGGGTLRSYGGGGTGDYIVHEGCNFEIHAPLEFAESSTFTGPGTFRFNGGTNSTFVCRGTVNLPGVCHVGLGALDFHGPFTVGTLVSDGGSVNFFGPTELTPGGAHNLSQCELNFNALQPALISGTLNNGSIGGSGDVRVAALMNIISSAMSGTGRTIVDDGVTVNLSTGENKTIARVIENHGELFVNGVIRLADGEIENHGTLRFDPGFQGTHSIQRAAGSAIVSNYGTLRKTNLGLGSLWSGAQSVPLHNFGDVQIEQGFFTVFAGGSNQGLINIDEPGSLVLAGSYVHGPRSRIVGGGDLSLGAGDHPLQNVAVTGTIEINGVGPPHVSMNQVCPDLKVVMQNGTLTVDLSQHWRGLSVLSGATLTGSGDITLSESLILQGTMTGTGTTEAGPLALLIISSNPVVSRTLVTRANGSWNGGTMTLSNGRWINHGTISMPNNECAARGGPGPGLLENRGSMTVNNTSGASFIAAPGPLEFQNHGYIFVGQGIMDVQCPGVGRGDFSIADGAMLRVREDFGAGFVTVNGELRVERRAQLHLAEGFEMGPSGILTLNRSPGALPAIQCAENALLLGALQVSMTPPPDSPVSHVLIASAGNLIAGQFDVVTTNPLGDVHIGADEVTWLIEQTGPPGTGHEAIDLLLAVLGSWGQCSKGPCAADVYPPGGDGWVDGADVCGVLMGCD